MSKIIRLTAENVKKLEAVEITPQGNVVEITGKNGAGKSTVLDCIFWTIAGSRGHQPEPLREGTDKARIQIDLDDGLVLKRTFRRLPPVLDDEGNVERQETVTTSVAVETEDGAKYPKPQEVLNKLYGTLAFDPLEFKRADAKTQHKMLADLLGLDFSELDKADADDRAKRTDLNRDAKSARARAAGIVVPEGTPDEPIDIAALSRRLTALGEANEARGKAEEQRRAVLRDLDAEQGYIERQESRANDLRAELEEVERDVHQRTAALKKRRDAFAALEALPDPIDPQPVLEELDKAETINKAVDARKRKAEETAEAERLEAESEALTKALDARKQERADVIAAADMPVPGLSLEDGMVRLDGFPLEQAAESAQMRLSCATAMRQHAKLRVILVRDASLLDDDSMAIIDEMAANAPGGPYQYWVERVDSSGKVGIVIEDGRVAKVN